MARSKTCLELEGCISHTKPGAVVYIEPQRLSKSGFVSVMPVSSVGLISKCERQRRNLLGHTPLFALLRAIGPGIPIGDARQGERRMPLHPCLTPTGLADVALSQEALPGTPRAPSGLPAYVVRG